MVVPLPRNLIGLVQNALRVVMVVESNPKA